MQCCLKYRGFLSRLAAFHSGLMGTKLGREGLLSQLIKGVGGQVVACWSPFILTFPSCHWSSVDMYCKLVLAAPFNFDPTLSQKPRAISFPLKRWNYQNHNRKEIFPFFFYLATKEIFLYYQITHIKVCTVLGLYPDRQGVS